MPGKSIDVACATDESYAPHAAALIRSVIDTNPSADLRLHVLHPPSFADETAERLTGMSQDRAAVRCHEISDPGLLGLPSMGRISQVMWYRLALPDLLPETERLLYLDCDTLALEPLAPLWELEMRGFSVAAVTNVFPPDLAHRPAELGLPATEYFNSGVLLMNLDAWRSADLTQRILRLARTHPERVVFPDQDALNIELRGSRLPLHPRWNCQNSILYLAAAEDILGVVPTAQARAHPAILHFEGPDWAKPWHYLSTHPFRHVYLDHRARTPWPDVRLEGRTIKNRIRRRLPKRAWRTLARLRGGVKNVAGRQS